MELIDPALILTYFYAAGDRGAESLWETVKAVSSGGKSQTRQRRLTVDGATVVQVSVARAGSWEAAIWQTLSQDMARWLGRSLESPPGHPWGGARLYLGAAVAGPYEERHLLREGLALPEEPTRQVAHLPLGRLWLVSPPSVADRGSVITAYAWFHAPSVDIKQQLEQMLWGENTPFLRSELYLHRALHQLRQYGREERARFWTALEQLETAVPIVLTRPADERCHERLRDACRIVMQGCSRLSRLHNLLRSSAHLYRQIGSELRQEKGGLFSWYEERQKEAMIQWGYDLERADRAISLTQTALLVCPPPRQAQPVQTGPHWILYVIAAAVVALCLVDASWWIVLIRAGVILLISLATWLLSLWQRRRQRGSDD